VKKNRQEGREKTLRFAEGGLVSGFDFGEVAEWPKAALC
jgi:hypothetical protein